MTCPKIFLFAPISDKKRYCLPKWLAMIKSFTYPNYQIYLVDNSANPEYHKYIRATWNLECDYMQPIGEAFEYITASQNMCRDKFLKSDCDFAFSLECDVFVPFNIMEYFMIYKLPVHNFTYFIRKAEETTYCLQTQNYSELLLKSMLVDHTTGFHQMTGEVKSIRDYTLGSFQKLSHAGIGCTNIRREVMEEVKFRIDKRSPLKFSDSYFHEDVYKGRFTNALDTTMLMEHDRDSWIPNLDYAKKQYHGNRNK